MKSFFNQSDKFNESTLYVGFRILFVQIFNVSCLYFVARILTPRDFGIFSIAMIIITCLNSFSSNGINKFIIYYSEISKKMINTAFFLSIAVSFILCLFGYFFSSHISVFFNYPELELILCVMLIRLPLESILSFLDAIINKDLKFKFIEARDVVFQIFSLILTLILAFKGFGYWSLILPFIIILPFKLFITFYFLKWYPKFTFSYSDAKKIYNYVVNLYYSNFIYFFINQGDNLVIGKYFGASSLGLYNLAWTNSNLVSKNISSLINKVSFPYFVKYKEDPKKFLSFLTDILEFLILLTLPIIIFLFVYAENFILTIFGLQWQESIIPFQILLIFAARYCIGSVLGPVFNAIGRTDILFKISLFTFPFYFAAIFTFLDYGIIGIAFAVTLVRTFFGLYSFYLAYRELKFSLRRLMYHLKSSFFISIIFFIFILIQSFYLNHLFSEYTIFEFIVKVVCSILTYYFLLRFMFFKICRKLYISLTKFIGKEIFILKFLFYDEFNFFYKTHLRKSLLRSINFPNSSCFIVSYPKSGNTFLRLLLSSCYKIEHSENLDSITPKSICNFMKMYVPDTYKFIKNQKVSDRFKLFKSHDINYPFFNKFKIILITREPVSTISSFYNYLNLKSKKKYSSEDVCFSRNLISYSAFYNSWSKRKQNILKINFQDLTKDTFVTLKKICKFLKLNYDDQVLKNAIKICDRENIVKFKNQIEYYSVNKQSEMFFNYKEDTISDLEKSIIQQLLFKQYSKLND